ncbi:ubiquitin recognition factor in ER-associated degradation protein 1-like [Centruroides sculpturatus]|uniref:ubiquitin recognition factor in ER-associated degradation protein 1-like n=1 Tax=Centruroides sculpturatus TaxID=218467 RepID=UPI000C6E5C5C|nr:ubiquitin recognition factor in ER-associated degradation protein 1-like [Centruroides sculpturatus]
MEDITIYDTPQGLTFNIECLSISNFEGKELEEYGGKIILPLTILIQYDEFDIEYPILLKLSCNKSEEVNQCYTHCGVLEFSENIKFMYIPFWMMRKLNAENGDIISATLVKLPTAKYVKFLPLTKEFFHISDFKKVLETTLLKYNCLTMGDNIVIYYQGKEYEICVKATEPMNSVCTIDCNLNVDIDFPVDYCKTDSDSIEEKQFTNLIENDSRGIPDFDYEIGTLKFIRSHQPSDEEFRTNGKRRNEGKDDSIRKKFKAFSGKGHSLK